ncbi:sugar kinase [Frondihabitans sucicola]|uniref:Sugar kinase n=1 Tax=Frondihabitans sucicola TaxID=1268041 RepID=A0ABN6Y3Y5_9MICO|nr:PfkB family carbohydrate kinase [Frondihabitans sucicola]BDZ51804.1 sugar kinase [Frondihabitans sucicola]
MPRTSPTLISLPKAETTSRVLVFGDVLDDIIVMPAKRPTTNTDTDARIRHRAGGSAANTAAWLGTLGIGTDFVGRVGVGDVQRHTQLLADAGVVPHLSHATSEHTGTVVITVEGAHRTMLTDRGASAGLVLDKITDELLRGVAAVHLTGYTVVTSRSPVAYRRLVSRIRAAGALVSIDPASSGFIADYGPQAFLDIVEGADLFFPSLDEGRLLSGEEEPEDVVRALAARFGVVALALPDGSSVAGRRTGKLVHSPPVASRFVDPIGVGDAFSAGFLCAWLQSPSLAMASRKGVKAAALALGVVGGRPAR